MSQKLAYFAAALFLTCFAASAKADSYGFTFTGAGVSGAVTFTYGTATDSKYPQAFALTGISGTFTDTNIGVVHQTITGLVPINFATPEATNLLAPHDFSKYTVATGLPPQNGGVLTFDNLYWPGGSPQTASSYPFHGGFVDIYGVLFTLANGDVVDFFSNGIMPGSTSSNFYGVGVATSAAALDYVGNVTATPEPGTLLLLGTGMLAFVLWRRPGLLGMRS